MIPMHINIAFDPASKDDDITVIMQVRGTKAERWQHVARIKHHTITEHDRQYAVGKAIKQMGEALIKGEVEWSTDGDNHGLPGHMLRVAVELDDHVTRLDALNAFVPSPVFGKLGIHQQSDLLLQQKLMDGLKNVLTLRLERARAERDA